MAPKPCDNRQHQDQADDQEEAVRLPYPFHPDMPTCPGRCKRGQDEQRNKSYARKKDRIMQIVSPETRMQCIIADESQDHTQQAERHKSEKDGFLPGMEYKFVHLVFAFKF